MTDHYQNRHKRAARVLTYALTLGDADSWATASAVWATLLEARETAALAFCALKSLSPNHARITAETALESAAGPPMPPLLNHMDEATYWADFANDAELKIYALVTYNRMKEPDQAAFLDYVNRRDAT